MWERKIITMSIPDRRITNRATQVVKTEKSRFIRPVERQRMRPWLMEHLDKNDIAGLVWQNKRDRIFRISWKHAANQCFNMQKDTNLFERWAIHTGIYSVVWFELFMVIFTYNQCPQISSVSAYNTQFKWPNTHRISFPGVSDTHVKFYFTQSFYIMRVIISPRETKHSWFSLPPLDCVEFHCFFQ